MKTKHVFYSLLVLLITFSGCREITVTTKINKNGSFTRTITIRGDSSELYDAGLPYPVDGTWISHVEPDTTEAGKFILAYSKTYATNDLLTAEIKNDTSWKKQLNRKIEIKKRVGLFYSYITYSETYRAANPFKTLNQQDFLTENDLKYIQAAYIPLTKQDSSLVEQAEAKMEDYLLQSISHEISNVLKEGILYLNKPYIDTSLVGLYKDSIDVKLSDWSFSQPGEFIGYFSEWTNYPEIAELNKIQPSLFDVQNQKFELIEKLIEMEGFTNEIEMPGLITATNSTNIIGNRLSWPVDSDSFLFCDYEMSAESRVINSWGFIFSGIIILTFFLVLLLKTSKNQSGI